MEIYFIGFNDRCTKLRLSISQENSNMNSCEATKLSKSASNYNLNCIDVGILEFDNSIYELIYNKIKKTEYKTTKEYFSEKFKITYRTFHIHHDKINSILSSCKLITMKYSSNYKRLDDKIEKFEISAKISKSLKCIVRYFHVFDDNGENLIFVTSDDKVFGIGKNHDGVLALGHEFEVKEPKIIQELCDKKVKEFYFGTNLHLAMTNDNNLFVWGKTHNCFNKVVDKLVQPVQIEYFNDKIIKQIGCCYNYKAVLTSDDKVHLLNNKLEKYNSPILLDIERPIKSIWVLGFGIFCVTHSGNVYFYRDNYYECSVYYIETITNVNFVAEFSDKIFFITIDSKIYTFNRLNFEVQPEKIHNELESELQVFQCSSGIQKFVIFNEKSVYEFVNDKFYETKYKNPFDYYCDKFGITYQTIERNVNEEYKSNASNTTNYFMKRYIEQEKDLFAVLKPFSIANKIELPRSFIKYFYVFNNNNAFTMLFVTNDDNVYGFGSNEYGCCGLGHNKTVSDPQRIPELCKQNVISFFNGRDFVLTLSSDNVVFAWGEIKVPKGIYSHRDISFSRPIQIFKFKCDIENISCSPRHALILTSESKIYGWGNNDCGQIGKGIGRFVETPIEIDTLPIKSISCSERRSFAVSYENYLFTWGYYEKEDIIKCPDDILTICPARSDDLYLLTRNKELMVSDIRDKKFMKIQFSYKIETIHFVISHYDSTPIGFVTEDGIYSIDKLYHIMQKTEYNTIYDFFAEEYQLTYKTIDLKLQNEIQTKSLQIKG